MDIEVLHAHRLDDGSILRAVRALTGSQPRWLLLWEVEEAGEIKRIELRPHGLGTSPRGFRCSERFTAGPADRPIGERRFHLTGDKERCRAVRLLAMRWRSGDGVFPTKFSLMGAFEDTVRQDGAKRAREARRKRKWQLLARHELADGRTLVQLQARGDTRGGADRGVVLRLGPNPVGLDFWIMPGQIGRVQPERPIERPVKIADPAALLAAIDAGGPLDQLRELLVDVDLDDFLGNRPGDMQRTWDLAVRQDSLARGAADGSISLLQRPPAAKSAVAAGQSRQPLAVQPSAAHPVLVSLTIQVPAELADDYRRRAQEDARLYLETHDAEVSSLAGGQQATSEEVEARRRARVMMPLAREPRPGRARIAAAAEALGLSMKQVYRQVGVLRRTPSWRALLPKRSGRPQGHAVLSEASERIIGSALDDDLDRPFGDLYRAVRENAQAAGVTVPDRKTVQRRLDSARKTRDIRRMVCSGDQLWKLAKRWAGFGWLQGPGKDSMLRLLGREARVWRDSEGWAWRVDDQPFQRSLKREDARKGAVHRILVQAFNERSISRDTESIFETKWQLADGLVDELAADWARTVLSPERRPFATTGTGNGAVLQLFYGPDEKLEIGLSHSPNGRWSVWFLEWRDQKQNRRELFHHESRAAAAIAAAAAAFRRYFAFSQVSAEARF